MKAIVSGASRGIGAAVAAALASKGYDLILCARTLKSLEQMAAELNEKHSDISISCFAVDLADEEDANRFAASALGKSTAIDVLVNNVGAYEVGHFTEESDDAVLKLFQANVLSANVLSRAVAPGMKARKSGHIFNICSVLSHEIRAGAAAYTVSKQALLALSKVMSEELRDFNVKVTAILPGSVNTSSWDGINAPKQDFVQPSDIAELIGTVLTLSPGALVDEIIIRPTRKDY